MTILDNYLGQSSDPEVGNVADSTGYTPAAPTESDQNLWSEAANLHNQATGNDSFIGNLGTRIAGIGESFANAPKFFGLSAVSAAFGVANTGIAIANWVSPDKTEELSVQKWANEYDSDLGKYYRENATGIDTTGFVLSSILPGLGGVKILNAGQKILRTAELSGTLGTSMSRASGLLIPKTEAYIATAADQLAASSQGFKYLQTGVVKSLASGLHQNVLEAAAFETFATAATFKSNFIDGMDASDIATNMATGILLGGVIGGVLAVPGIKKGILKATVPLDDMGKGALFQPAPIGDVPDSVKGAQHFLNRKSVEDWQALNKAGPKPGDPLPDPRSFEVIQKQVRDSENTIEDINNKIRLQVRAITPTDAAANDFADNIIKLSSDDGANLMLGTKGLVRTGDIATPPVGKNPARGQQSLEGSVTEPIIDSASSGIQWNKIFGSQAGSTFDEMPTITQIADRVKLTTHQTIESAVDKIVDSFKHTTKRPLDVMGSRGSLNEVQSRYIASNSFKLEGPQAIKESDIPVLEAAYSQFDQVGRVDIVNVKGAVVNSIDSQADLLSAIAAAKDKVISRGKARGISDEEIAQRANVRTGFIDGTEVQPNVYDNYFARQSYAKDLGITPEQLAYKPSFMGAVQDSQLSKALTDTELDAQTLIKQMYKVSQASIDNAVAAAGSYLGKGQIKDMATGSTAVRNYTDMLPTNAEIQSAITNTNRFGSGARLSTFANGNYGDAESMMQYIGKIKATMDDVGTNAAKTAWEPILRVIRSDTAAATELSVLNETVARMPIRYGLDPNNASRLIPLVHIDDALNQVPLRQLDPGILAEIPIRHPAVLEAAATHISLNGSRIAGRKTLRAAGSGDEYNVDPRAFYPIKPDPATTPFHAMVTDPSITGAGRSSMIHATSAAQLDAMMRRVKEEFPTWHVFTNKQSNDYHKAVGDFEYSKTMSDDYIDTSLRTKGINSQSLPQTDGNLVAGKFENWHDRQIRGYNAEIISTKYASEFDTLTSLGREFSSLNEAQYPTISDIARGVKSNPYVEYVKTALNVSNIADYGWLTNVNKFLDSAVSSVWNKAAAKIREIKGVKQGELDTINKVFADSGFKTAYYDAATHLLANHPADNAVLSRFIRGTNSLLATTFLRADPLNAINNKIGSLILTSTETRHLIQGIENGDASIVGKLAQLGKVKVPGTEDSILSASKLMMRAYQEFFTRKDLVKQAIESGLIPADVTKAFKVIDNLTLNGTETSLQLNNKLQDAFDTAKEAGAFAEKWTGNKIVEGMNRYVSYSVMRQLTGLAQEGGLISKTEAGSYINTFVNRTQVNLTASQRPLIFQGPIGMAMGLFQSYQFNLMQQLFRYVGDGSKKTAAFMMGMQTSMYGLNGLPGFQAFNQHIIGEAAGNFGHQDISSAIYDSANMDVANFLLYGAPSNMLRANLYTRGDLTPQRSTILPTSIGDIAAVSMYGKFFSNLKNTVTNIAGGADIWKSVLSGLEHNSMNRPLAGLAQTLRGFNNGNVYSTDNSGNVLASNDLFSVATLARLAGGRPFDEAIVRDTRWRISAYRQFDLQRRADASTALRTSLADSGTASSAQLNSVFDIYLQTGGRQADFNKWMAGQYKRANTSEATKMGTSLSDPYAYRMQLLMGGADDVAFGSKLNSTANLD